jgi:E3 ubiquitin-protein ligase HERC4
VHAIACGAHHSLFVMRDGALWSCGMGADGQLGHGNTESLQYPRQIESVHHINMRSAAEGDRQSLVLTANGRVLAFGFGLSGALGQGSYESHHHPVLIESLLEHRITE